MKNSTNTTYKLANIKTKRFFLDLDIFLFHLKLILKLNQLKLFVSISSYSLTVITNFGDSSSLLNTYKSNGPILRCRKFHMVFNFIAFKFHPTRPLNRKK